MFDRLPRMLESGNASYGTYYELCPSLTRRNDEVREMGVLDGKVALVTRASKGIGTGVQRSSGGTP